MAFRSVYIETTVLSYLVARPSKNFVLAAHQKITKEWWATRRKDFDLFGSQVVLDEAGVGEKEMADKRLTLASELTMVDIDIEALFLVKSLAHPGPIPPKAARDAFHIAAAAVHELDFLLTWNCKHLANAEIADRVDRIVLRHGFKPPRICTPLALMGGFR